MSASDRLAGVPASPGYAEGPLFRLDGPEAVYVAKSSAEAERAALLEALETASASLAVLIETASGEAAEMLEFQLAMLEDDALRGPALDAIERGKDAAAAWREALDAEIAGYQASGDDYFKARAADLADIRDQVLRALTGAEAGKAPSGAILAGEDITPTRFLQTDWSSGGGIALAAGSPASHVAMLARARGVPMVVGLGAGLSGFSGQVMLDAEHGSLARADDAVAAGAFREAAAGFRQRRALAETYLNRPAATADGTSVRVQVNVADPSDVDHIDVDTCDGVGLMRTEFLFGKAGGLPDEQTQYVAYRKVLEWAGGKPVTIRTDGPAASR